MPSKPKKPETLDTLRGKYETFSHDLPGARIARERARHTLDEYRANVAKCKLAVRAAGSGAAWADAKRALQRAESSVPDAAERLANAEARYEAIVQGRVDLDRLMSELREQEAAPEISADDLRNAALGYVSHHARRYAGDHYDLETIQHADMHGRKLAIELIRRQFKVRKVRDIPPEQWPQAIEALSTRD